MYGFIFLLRSHFIIVAIVMAVCSSRKFIYFCSCYTVRSDVFFFSFVRLYVEICLLFEVPETENTVTDIKPIYDTKNVPSALVVVVLT